MNNKILLLSGDPYSINSELIFKTWKKLNKRTRKKIFLISNYELIKNQFKKLKFPMKIVKVKNLSEDVKSNYLKIINLDINFVNPFDISKKNRSEFVLKCLNKAHNLALRKDVAGIINCAIDKKILEKDRTGVTEYLASKCNVKNDQEVMMIRNKYLSVVPITTHIDIKQISNKLSSKKIVNKIKTIETWFKINLEKKVRIGILGLNPHNAELRKNSEERRIIIPAIKRLKALKSNVKGPLVSDTLFINDYKKFDVIVGMFHDQVLSPFKAIFKFNAINITIGLPFLKITPDHGPNFDMIGKNKSDPSSLFYALDFLDKIK